MELFSEVHGLYYQMISDILTQANSGSISKQQIQQIIGKQGFQETLYSLSPMLLESGKADSYNLLTDKDGAYESVLDHPPIQLMTDLEKMWLKAMLIDPRIHLFLSDVDYHHLIDTLDDVEPLYDPSEIITVGQAMDGDPFTDEKYQEHFHKILHGITCKKILRITYMNAKGTKSKSCYVPHRLEYSIKDDKFRLNAAQIDRGKLIYYSKINVARIVDVTTIEDGRYPEDVGTFIRSHKHQEPIEIELTNQRQGFERCFIHLSNYERNTEYNEETGSCRVKIYYYDVDEPELIIMLLSYGPILKVLGPPSFKKKFVNRLMKQKELFAYHNQWDD